MPPRRGRSPKNWKFFFGVAIGVAPVVILGGVDASALEVGILFGDEQDPPATLGNPFYIESDDVEYLNRIFSERTHEIGYCISLDGNTLSFWLADTMTAAEGSLKMEASNCPPDMQTATAHTHPNGRIGLSEQDQSTLVMSGGWMMCIHAGRLNREPGTELKNIACYMKTENGGIAQIPIRVAGSGEETPQTLGGSQWGA